MKEYEKHIIICTGCDPSEWGAKINTQEGSFASAFHDALKSRKSDLKKKGVKVMITNCDERSYGQSSSEQPTCQQAAADFIVFPERVRYVGVTVEQLEVCNLQCTHKQQLLSNIAIRQYEIVFHRGSSARWYSF